MEPVASAASSAAASAVVPAVAPAAAATVLGPFPSAAERGSRAPPIIVATARISFEEDPTGDSAFSLDALFPYSRGPMAAIFGSPSQSVAALRKSNVSLKHEVAAAAAAAEASAENASRAQSNFDEAAVDADDSDLDAVEGPSVSDDTELAAIRGLATKGRAPYRYPRLNRAAPGGSAPPVTVNPFASGVSLRSAQLAAPIDGLHPDSRTLVKVGSLLGSLGLLPERPLPCGSVLAAMSQLRREAVETLSLGRATSAAELEVLKLHALRREAGLRQLATAKPTVSSGQPQHVVHGGAAGTAPPIPGVGQATSQQMQQQSQLQQQQQQQLQQRALFHHQQQQQATASQAAPRQSAQFAAPAHHATSSQLPQQVYGTHSGAVAASLPGGGASSRILGTGGGLVTERQRAETVTAAAGGLPFSASAASVDVRPTVTVPSLSLPAQPAVMLQGAGVPGAAVAAGGAGLVGQKRRSDMTLGDVVEQDAAKRGRQYQ
jgi:hypothetical protein